MRVGARETAEIGAVAFADARHEEAHRRRRRLWLLLLRDGRAAERRQRERDESEFHGFHRFPRGLSFECARPGSAARFDSKPGMRSSSLKEAEGLTRIDAGPLSLAYILDVAVQAAEGLEAAHRKGVIHRDIKPDNLFVTEASSRRIVRIMDFGLAQLAGGSRLTREQTSLGTVGYMSPEQAQGQEVDATTDVWALGVVLYRLVCLAPPFPARTRPQLAWDLAYAPHLPAQCRVPALPRDVSTIIDRVLAKQPCARYPSTRDLAHALHDARAALRARQCAHEAGESYAFGG